MLISTTGERIVLPRHLLDEARRIPDEFININKAIDKVRSCDYDILEYHVDGSRRMSQVTLD